MPLFYFKAPQGRDGEKIANRTKGDEKMTTLKYVLIGKPGESSANGEARGWTSYIVRGGIAFSTVEEARKYIEREEATSNELKPIEISEKFDLSDPTSNTLYNAIIATIRSDDPPEPGLTPPALL